MSIQLYIFFFVIKYLNIGTTEKLQRTSRSEGRRAPPTIERRMDIDASGSENYQVIPVKVIVDKRFVPRNEHQQRRGNNQGQERSSRPKPSDEREIKVDPRNGNSRGVSTRVTETLNSRETAEQTSRSRSAAGRSLDLAGRDATATTGKPLLRKRVEVRKRPVEKVNNNKEEEAARNRGGRGRSRADVTVDSVTSVDDTTVPPFVTSTQAPAAATRPTTTARAVVTTSRGRRRNEPEDFFNHGLGFRGRKVHTEGPSDPATQRPGDYQGNPGWLLKRRPIPRTVENEQVVVGSTDQMGNNEIPTTIATPPNDVRSVSRGSARVTTIANDETTTTASPVKSGRRGNKTYQPLNSRGSAKGTKEQNESDNYPQGYNPVSGNDLNKTKQKKLC